MKHRFLLFHRNPSFFQGVSHWLCMCVWVRERARGCVCVCVFVRAWNSLRKQGFSRKWKSKIAEKYILHGKKWTNILVFLWKLRLWICECYLMVQNWYSSWILVCYIFFEFASRMPQITQILVSTFKIFQGGGEGGCFRTPLEIASFFFSFFLAIPGSAVCV